MNSVVLDWTGLDVMDSIVLHWIALYWTVLYWIVLCCTGLHCTAFTQRWVLRGTVL